MDIHRIRYFHVFAETGSLVKACEILGITQPALSKALKTLESEIGLKLLEPEGRGLRLTEMGISFRNETANLLQQWFNVPQRIKSNKSTHFNRFGSFEVFTTYFLSHLCKFINLDGLEVHQLGPGKIEQAVADRQIDAGVTYIPIPKQGVEFIEITKIKMGVYGNKKFKSYKFNHLPFVVPLFPADGTPSKVVGMDGWPDQLYPRFVNNRVTSLSSALELCKLNYCVAYLPNFLVQLFNQEVNSDLQLLELESPIQKKHSLQSVYLIQNKIKSETTFIRQIAKSVRSLK